MKILNLLAFTVLSVIASTAFAQQFKINGTAEGLNDQAWLYLKTTDEAKLDSCMVKDGKFQLAGKINAPQQMVMLHDVKSSNYVFFWLEPKSITISLKKGEFKKAIITGSATQDENNRLTKLIEPFRLKIDSLSALIKTLKNTPQKLSSAFDELELARQKEQEAYQNYVKDNPNNFMAVKVLNVYATGWGKEKVKELYANLSNKMKNAAGGKDLLNYITLSQEIVIGKKYADFEQMNAQEKSIKLSSIKAKYLLLEFWASWCGPCRGENPNLVKTYNAYKDKGFEIFGVSADNDKAAWLKAIKDDQLPWTNVSDLKGDKNLAVLIYGISAFPTNYLIDENGIIIAKNLRGDDLKKKLSELLH